MAGFPGNKACLDISRQPYSARLNLAPQGFEIDRLQCGAVMLFTAFMDDKIRPIIRKVELFNSRKLHGSTENHLSIDVPVP